MEAIEGNCSRCRERPRVLGQRWCRACLTAYAKKRRAKKRAAVTRSPLPRVIPAEVWCGQKAPPGFPRGCGKPFRPPVGSAPIYCCNGCGAGKTKHSDDCPISRKAVISVTGYGKRGGGKWEPRAPSSPPSSRFHPALEHLHDRGELAGLVVSEAGNCRLSSPGVPKLSMAKIFLGRVIQKPSHDPDSDSALPPPAFSAPVLPGPLHFAYYNFCRIHATLRVTPAMAAGITDRVWGLRDLVEAHG